MRKTRIYFGSPLFSEMELMYNKYVVGKLREVLGDKVEIYLPQENEAINDKSGYADSIMIAEGDNQYLEDADILIAVLDGQVVDVGLASEIGYARARGKRIIGLYTDTRQGTFGNERKIEALDVLAESQFSYVNLYTIGLVKKSGFIVNSSEELIKAVEKNVKQMRGEI